MSQCLGPMLTSTQSRQEQEAGDSARLPLRVDGIVQLFVFSVSLS